MKNSNLQDLKIQKESKFSQLILDCKMFFAFSNEQFNASKTELKEGEKYVSIGAGAYLPKSYVTAWIEGSENITKWYNLEVKKSKNDEAEILYELRNYEAFYTYDIEDAFEVLKDRYTLAQVWAIFNKYKKAELQD